MRLTAETELLQYLAEHAIPYERIEHEPVFTCEQAEIACHGVEGVSTKNLFLRDKKGRLRLLMTDCARTVNMKALSVALAAPKLHFASPECLWEVLGLTPGAVTVLALVNDEAHQVELVIDDAIWGEAVFLCHPLVNTATLALRKPDLERFFALTGHSPRLVKF